MVPRRPALGLFNPEIVGGSLKPCMKMGLVTNAVTVARPGKRPRGGWMHHCDCGSQSASQPLPNG